MFPLEAALLFPLSHPTASVWALFSHEAETGHTSSRAEELLQGFLAHAWSCNVLVTASPISVLCPSALKLLLHDTEHCK